MRGRGRRGLWGGGGLEYGLRCGRGAIVSGKLGWKNLTL